MVTNTTNNRWRLSVAAGLTLIALLGACAGSEPEALIGGLDISAAIQQGGSFEMTLPIRENTFVGVVDEPAGVTTLLSHADNGKALKVSLDVAADAPVGSYNLILRAEDGGEPVDFEWPFIIVESDS